MRQATRIVDGDATLVSFVEEHIASSHRGEGRPNELPIRTALVCFVLLALVEQNFHVLNLPPLLASMSWRTRRLLGIDYLDARGVPKQVSYQQLLRAFHTIATAFAPLDAELDDAAAYRRAEALRELSFRLVQASISTPGRPRDYAVDATLKWGWDRPGGLHAKIERRGRDGDAGPVLCLSDVVGDDAPAFVRDPIAQLRARSTKRHGPRTWGPGSAWVGRENKRKSVYGIAMHAVTLSTKSAPPVIEAITVTPAPALPSAAALPLLQLLTDHRGQRAGLSIGEIVADPAYSLNPRDWQVPIRELGGAPVFRLHRTNQAGRQLSRGITFVDGRPYCSCLPEVLVDLPFPRFPSRRAQNVAFQQEVAKRRRWEMSANTAFRDDGCRQFKSHWDSTRRSGGCLPMAPLSSIL